jgi:hypothetical protein
MLARTGAQALAGTFVWPATRFQSRSGVVADGTASRTGEGLYICMESVWQNRVTRHIVELHHRTALERRKLFNFMAKLPDLVCQTLDIRISAQTCPSKCAKSMLPRAFSHATRMAAKSKANAIHVAWRSLIMSFGAGTGPYLELKPGRLPQLPTGRSKYYTTPPASAAHHPAQLSSSLTENTAFSIFCSLAATKYLAFLGSPVPSHT